jgi:hypothetical protein
VKYPRSLARKRHQNPRRVVPSSNVRHTHFLPDGAKSPSDFEWLPSPSLEQLMQLKWERWRAAKDSVDRDWLTAQQERLAEIALVIDADRRKTQLEREEEKADAYAAEDQRETTRFLDALHAETKRKADQWFAEAKARLEKATREMNADIARRDRQLLAMKRR